MAPLFYSGLTSTFGKSNVVFKVSANFDLRPGLVNNFYGNTARTTHLHIFCGSFCSIMSELNSCQRESMAHKTKHIYYLTFYGKSLPSPATANRAKFMKC